MNVKIRLLGQSGVRFEFPNTVLYIDPYLSNSVEKLEGKAFKRKIAIPIAPDTITDADWILITHAHQDHCDQETIQSIINSSRHTKIMAPRECQSEIERWSKESIDIQIAQECWTELSKGLKIRAVPAAHPKIERNDDGELRCVGYVLNFLGKYLYVAGDTSPHQELIDTLKALGGIELGFIPVNEANFFKERAGIIGNMSVREAFFLGREIRVKTLIPVHWDMFGPNSVFTEEIELLYRKLAPPFNLEFYPEVLNVS